MSDDRLRYLDGLRGILAIIVFLHHFFYIFYPDIIFGGNYEEYLRKGMSFDKFMAFTPLNMFFNPGTAIHFFFFLSGYVQSFHYLKNPELSILQKSFIKRYFRLAIPTLIVMLLVFTFHKLHLVNKEYIPKDPVTGDWSKSMLPDNLGFFGVVKQALIDIFVRDFRYYQILWTMPIELSNSWMVLILLFISHHIPHRIRLLVFWLVVQLFFTRSYYSAAFTFGILLCYAEINLPKFRSFFSGHLIRFLCLVIGIYFASYPFIGFEKSTLHTIYRPISFFEKIPHIISYLVGDLLLFLYLLRSNTIKKVLSKPVFQFFGNISFMFYLLHMLILFSFSPWLYHALLPHASRTWNLFITSTASFFVITAGSQLLYNYIDKPVLKWCSIYMKKFLGI